MKTIKNITLTAILIIITANITLSNNYRTFRIQTAAGKIIEIFSIIESPVDEIIPGFESFISEMRYNNHVDINEIEIYTEPEVDDGIVVFAKSSFNYSNGTYKETLDFVKSIYQPEETIDDFSFDTNAIIKEYQEEGQKTRHNIVSNIIEHEEDTHDNSLIMYYPFFTLVK